eukprot:403367054
MQKITYGFGTKVGQFDFDPRVNYYQKLGLIESASEAEIKKAFYSLAKKYHPDSNIDKKSQTSNEEKFKDASGAYEVLSDTSKKSQYDEMRKEYNSQFGNSSRTSSNSNGFSSSSSSTGNGEYTYKYDSQGYASSKARRESSGAYKAGYHYQSPHESYDKHADQDNGFSSEGRRNFEKKFYEFRDNYNNQDYQEYINGRQRFRQEQYRWKSYQYYEKQYQKYSDEFEQQKKEYFDNLHQQRKMREEYMNQSAQASQVALRKASTFMIIMSSIIFTLFMITAQDNKYREIQKQQNLQQNSYFCKEKKRNFFQKLFQQNGNENKQIPKEMLIIKEGRESNRNHEFIEYNLSARIQKEIEQQSNDNMKPDI